MKPWKKIWDEYQVYSGDELNPLNQSLSVKKEEKISREKEGNNDE